MPCGGIHPIPEDFAPSDESSWCFYCNKPVDKYDLFCDEWDCFIHYECVHHFLVTREGEIVIKHGHRILAYPRQFMIDYYKEQEEKQ